MPSPSQHDQDHADMTEFYQRALKMNAPGRRPDLSIQVEERQVTAGRFVDPDIEAGKAPQDKPTLAPPKPTVTSITPNAGSPSGGLDVTVAGTNFIAGATVKLGGTLCTQIVFVDDKTITCVTPAHAAGVVSVLVTNIPNGPVEFQGTLTNGFTYQAAPSISSLDPNMGPLAGNNWVRIFGSNFVSIDAVSFGGVNVTHVVLHAGAIDAILPAHAEGPVNVVVANTYGDAGVKVNGYTYMDFPFLYRMEGPINNPDSHGPQYVYSNNYYLYRITALRADGSVQTGWQGGVGVGASAYSNASELAGIGVQPYINWSNGVIYLLVKLLKTHLDPGTQVAVQLFPWDLGVPRQQGGFSHPLVGAPGNWTTSVNKSLFGSSPTVQLYYGN